MDIEEFYDQDPRRRTSEEFEFGRDWRDADGGRRALTWIQDTGELYAMREPTEPIIAGVAGDEYLAGLPTDTVTVEVLGRVATLAEVEQVLSGWPEAMPEPTSLQWVRDRLSGPVPGPSGPTPPDEAPEEFPGAKG